jgi:hypothetical protein
MERDPNIHPIQSSEKAIREVAPMKICTALKRHVKNLGKIGLGALVSMPYPLQAQVERGTVIVVYFSQEKIVVASDSLNLKIEAGSEQRECGCKIVALSRTTLFAATGYTGHRKGVLDPSPGWTAIDEAKRIFNLTDDVTALSAHWANALAGHVNLELTIPESRKQIEKVARENGGTVTNGLFLSAPVGSDLQVTLAKITYAGSPAPEAEKNSENITQEKAATAPMGPYFAVGLVDTVAEYVRLRSDRAKSEVEKWNQEQQSLQGDKEAFRTKRLVELAIENDRTGYIGGKIDVAVLPKNGTLQWIANSNCK